MKCYIKYNIHVFLTRSYCDLCSFPPVVKAYVTVIANCWFIMQTHPINERKALNLQNKYKPLPLRYSLPVVWVLCKIMFVFQRLGCTSSLSEPTVSPGSCHRFTLLARITSLNISLFVFY